MSISTEIILKRRIEAQEARYKEMLAAAEFEARVAVWLANHHNFVVDCPKDGCMKSCDAHVLKIARLAVEAEMATNNTDAFRSEEMDG